MTQLKYFSSVPVAAATVTPPDWCEALSLAPAGLLATLTVNMPKWPADGQPFTINSTQVVTALTHQVQSGSGQTLVGGLAALAIGVAGRWVYDAPNATWRPA